MTTKTKTNVLKFRVPIIVEQDTVGFHAYSPIVKGLHMDGDTEKEALENAKETAKDFLEIMIEDGLPIPLGLLSIEISATREKGYYEEEIIVQL